MDDFTTVTEFIMKPSNRSKMIIVDLVSALYVLLFIYAAMSKILEFEKFKVELGKSPILNSVSSYVAFIIPLLEFGIFFLFIFKRFQLIGFYFSFTIMVIFSSYIIVIQNFSEYVPCSCGGILQNMSWNQHLVFNLLFVVIGIASILIYPTSQTELLANNGSMPKIPK